MGSCENVSWALLWLSWACPWGGPGLADTHYWCHLSGGVVVTVVERSRHTYSSTMCLIWLRFVSHHQLTVESHHQWNSSTSLLLSWCIMDGDLAPDITPPTATIHVPVLCLLLGLCVRWHDGRALDLQSCGNGLGFQLGHCQLVTTFIGECLRMGQPSWCSEQIGSAFHPSGVGKSSISFAGWGWPEVHSSVPGDR